jgi:two-component system sensor histidine kinase DctS
VLHCRIALGSAQLGYTRRMWSDHEFASLPPVSTARQRSWRTVLSLLPALLVLTILASLVWLPWQAQKTESGERQEQLIADTLWVDQGIRLQLAQDEETLRSIGAELQSGRLSAIALKARLAPLLAARRELRRVLWLDVNGNLLGASDDTTDASRTPTERAATAADQARRTGKARYSAPATSTPGVPGAALEYHLPLMDGTHFRGSLVATFSTAAMLETLVPWWFAQDNEITLTGADDNVLERRAAGGPGRGIYTHSHVLDLPGANLTLRTNSLKTLPKLLPNLLIVSVLALSLALVASLVALRRDIARRLAVESALRQQVSFRTAM